MSRFTKIFGPLADFGRHIDQFDASDPAVKGAQQSLATRRERVPRVRRRPNLDFGCDAAPT